MRELMNLSFEDRLRKEKLGKNNKATVKNESPSIKSRKMT